MTLRTHISRRQKLAHEILDAVKAGLDISALRVRWALVVLGDGTA